MRYLFWSGRNHRDVAQITEVLLQTGIKLRFVNQFSLAVLQLDQEEGGDITDAVDLDGLGY